MYTILHGAGVVGVLTSDELRDILLQMLRDERFRGYDRDKQLKKVPNFLRDLLGWGADDTFILALARSVLREIGEYLWISPDAAIDFITPGSGGGSL